MKPSFISIESDRCQVIPALQSPAGAHYGCFWFFCKKGDSTVIIRCVVHDGIDRSAMAGWEHVSVSVAEVDMMKKKEFVRTPAWDEMCFVKDKFWDEDETVVQFHPPKAEYVNNHPHTLHLWRNLTAKQPRPPMDLV